MKYGCKVCMWREVPEKDMVCIFCQPLDDNERIIVAYLRQTVNPMILGKVFSNPLVIEALIGDKRDEIQALSSKIHGTGRP